MKDIRCFVFIGLETDGDLLHQRGHADKSSGTSANPWVSFDAAKTWLAANVAEDSTIYVLDHATDRNADNLDGHANGGGGFSVARWSFPFFCNFKASPSNNFPMRLGGSSGFNFPAFSTTIGNFGFQDLTIRNWGDTNATRMLGWSSNVLQITAPLKLESMVFDQNNTASRAVWFRCKSDDPIVLWSKISIKNCDSINTPASSGGGIDWRVED